VDTFHAQEVMAVRPEDKCARQVQQAFANGATLAELEQHIALLRSLGAPDDAHPRVGINDDYEVTVMICVVERRASAFLLPARQGIDQGTPRARRASRGGQADAKTNRRAEVDMDLPADVAARAALFRETAEHHDHYEKTHAPHNWWDWYSAYFGAREHGRTPDEAVRAANRYMDEVLHIATL
jgi:hypothetical protein